MVLRAGDLDQSVTIQREERVSDGQGGYETSWTSVVTAPTVPANIVGMSGDEAVQASIERAVSRWRVIIHMRSDITPKNRLLWTWRGGSTVLNITSVLPWTQDPRAALLLICESGASADGS